MPYRIVSINHIDEISSYLNNNKIVVMPTDTIYGIHCKYNNKNLRNKIANIKNRSKKMPFIILISNLDQLSLFNVNLNECYLGIFKKYWPGKNTLIIKNKDGDKIAFRLPDSEFLTDIIKNVGPIISTSANKHKHPPAINIDEAINYFGDEVDLYVDGGTIDGTSSSIYDIEDGNITQIR